MVYNGMLGNIIRVLCWCKFIIVLVVYIKLKFKKAKDKIVIFL